MSNIVSKKKKKYPDTKQIKNLGPWLFYLCVYNVQYQILLGSLTKNNPVGSSVRECQEMLAELDYSLKSNKNIPPSIINFARFYMSRLTPKQKVPQ